MIVWYPGEEFGPALASVLAGDREPSGRLPVSFAADESHYPVFNATPAPDGSLPYEEGTKIGYRGFTETPAYAFGAGRGYGAFTLIDAKVIAPLSVAVSVRNDAPRASAFVAQLYRVADGALIGFAKQVVAAGETAILTVIVDPIALRRWTDAGWQMPDGPVAAAIGASSIDLPLRIDLPVA
jgi:beta-glucosidase